MKFHIVIFSFSLFVVGCSVKSPASRVGEVPGTPPPRWIATKEAQVGIDTRWVRRIGGAELEGLVANALGANPDMRVASERVFRALVAAKTAGANLKPQVTAGGNGSRTKQVFVGFPFGDGGVPSTIFNTYGANLTVSWEPDIWGAGRAGQEALIADAQAEANNFRAARASLAAQVARAWLALTESNEQLALTSRNIALLKKTEDIVKDRFMNALTDEGGSVSELRLAQSERAAQEARLAEQAGDREVAIRQIEILMGQYPAGAVRSKSTLPKVPPVPPAGLPSELLLRRPDILEAERRFASSGSLVKQARLAYYPSFSLTASGGTTTDSLRDIFNSDFGVWSLAGAVTQPIWANGALRLREEELKSSERSMLAELQGTVVKAFGEVEQALVAEHFFEKRTEALENAVEAAVNAAEAASNEYSEGTGDALTLINTLRNQVDLTSQLVTLRRLRLDNRVTLHLALGGDYRPGK